MALLEEMPGPRTSLLENTREGLALKDSEGGKMNSTRDPPAVEQMENGTPTLSDAEIAWKLHQELNQTRSRRFQDAGASSDKHPTAMASRGNSSAWQSSDNEKNGNVARLDSDSDSDNDGEVQTRKSLSRKGKPESSLDIHHAAAQPKSIQQKRKQPRPPKPIKIPKLPMVRQGNKWYRARVVQETETSAQFEFAGYEAVMPMIWLPRNSDRIWFGSYKGKDWRYLGGGAWEPKSKVKNRVPQTDFILANGSSGLSERNMSLGQEAGRKRTLTADEAGDDHFVEHKLHPLTDTPEERLPLSSRPLSSRPQHSTKSAENKATNGDGHGSNEDNGTTMGSKRKKLRVANGNLTTNGNGIAMENGRGVRGTREKGKHEEKEEEEEEEVQKEERRNQSPRDPRSLGKQPRPKRSSRRNTQIYNNEEFAVDGEVLDAVGDPPHPGWYYVVPDQGEEPRPQRGQDNLEDKSLKEKKSELETNQVHHKQSNGSAADPGRRRRKPVVSSPAPTDVAWLLDPLKQLRNKGATALTSGNKVEEMKGEEFEPVADDAPAHGDSRDNGENGENPQPSTSKNNHPHQPNVPSSKGIANGIANGIGNGNGTMKNRSSIYPSKPGRPRKAERGMHQRVNPKALNRSFSQPGSVVWGDSMRKPACGGDYFRRAASMDSLLTAGKRFGKLLGAVAERLGHLASNCPTTSFGSRDCLKDAAWSQHTWVATDSDGSPPAILNVPMELFRLPLPSCSPQACTPTSEKGAELTGPERDHKVEGVEREGEVKEKMVNMEKEWKGDNPTDNRGNPAQNLPNVESPKGEGNAGSAVSTKPPVPLFC